MDQPLNQLNWNLDEPDTSQVKLSAQIQYEENVDFLKAFSTPSGKKVLEWLTAHTLDTPTWWPSADYNKSVANGFYREGQNCLVRQLLSKIKQAKEYKHD